ncbi:MAG: glycosyltransferase family 4 protein [Elainellaceae cyanobacterium]
MKIAVVGSKGLPPKQGGIEHHCAEVYPRIAAQGHLVDLMARTSYTQMSWRDRFDFQGVRVSSFPGVGESGLDALLTSSTAAVTSSILKYDVIHFHALGPSLWTWLPPMTSSAKVVVTCHGLDWQREKWGTMASSLIRLGELAAVRFAHRITVVSEELQRYFYDAHGLETQYIGNAPASYAECDQAFSYGSSLGLKPKRYIAFLGRLVPEKCPDLLIRAFQKLQQDDWSLVVIGNNQDSSEFSKQLSQMAANQPNIVFTGELRGKRLSELMRNAGLFVLPSNLEGLPLAMLEAMNENIPVLASDIPVHRKLLGSERGLLFEAASEESCLTHMRWALQNLSYLKQMTDNAKQYVEKYHNWDYIAQDYVAVYENLLQSAGLAAIKDESSLPTQPNFMPNPREEVHGLR